MVDEFVLHVDAGVVTAVNDNDNDQSVSPFKIIQIHP